MPKRIVVLRTLYPRVRRMSEREARAFPMPMTAALHCALWHTNARKHIAEVFNFIRLSAYVYYLCVSRNSLSPLGCGHGEERHGTRA